MNLTSISEEGSVLSQKISNDKNLLDKLNPNQRKELEKLKQEALNEPPSFFEYIEVKIQEKK